MEGERQAERMSYGETGWEREIEREKSVTATKRETEKKKQTGRERE